MKFSENNNNTRYRSFGFDDGLNPGIIFALISNIRGVGPWQRYALSEYSCFNIVIKSV